jgi:hypothetical protein
VFRSVMRLEDSIGSRREKADKDMIPSFLILAEFASVAAIINRRIRHRLRANSLVE